MPICGTDNEQEGEDTIIGMNRHKRVRCALALLTMLTAGLLSGCVSDAASDSTLPTITVGSDTYPPYVYMDNNGDITGLDVDIAEEAFRRMGYRAEFTTIDWEQKTKLVDNGEIDCIWDCFSMDGRENDYQWAGPYLVSRQVIAVSAQSSSTATAAPVCPRRYSAAKSGVSSIRSMLSAFGIFTSSPPLTVCPLFILFPFLRRLFHSFSNFLKTAYCS